MRARPHLRFCAGVVELDELAMRDASFGTEGMLRDGERANRIECAARDADRDGGDARGERREERQPIERRRVFRRVGEE